MMKFRVSAHGQNFDVTLLVAFDQTVPALIPLFANTPRKIFSAYQAIEAAVKYIQQLMNQCSKRTKQFLN